VRRPPHGPSHPPTRITATCCSLPLPPPRRRAASALPPPPARRDCRLQTPHPPLNGARACSCRGRPRRRRNCVPRQSAAGALRPRRSYPRVCRGILRAAPLNRHCAPLPPTPACLPAPLPACLPARLHSGHGTLSRPTRSLLLRRAFLPFHSSTGIVVQNCTQAAPRQPLPYACHCPPARAVAALNTSPRTGARAPVAPRAGRPWPRQLNGGGLKPRPPNLACLTCWGPGGGGQSGDGTTAAARGGPAACAGGGGRVGAPRGTGAPFSPAGGDGML
jgi:hypothetical protein